MSRCIKVVLLATAGCADDNATAPVEVPIDPGELHATPPPAGFEGPVQNALRIAFSGQMDNTGFALAHLPPEAGAEVDRIPPLWIACHVRENGNADYTRIDPVENSPLPCGFLPHENHVDAVISAIPWWMALIVVNVP